MGKRSFDDQKYGLAIQWYSRAIEHLRSLPGSRPCPKAQRQKASSLLSELRGPAETAGGLPP